MNNKTTIKVEMQKKHRNNERCGASKRV